MSLYCLACRVFAYKNHKCDIRTVIPIKCEMRGIADRLYALELDPMSAAWFTHPIQDSLYEHGITIDIDFKYQFAPVILGDLPTGWAMYTETVTPDHLPVMVLIYSERYVWLGFETVEQRVQEIIKEFEEYLDTRDKDALIALRLLTEC